MEKEKQHRYERQDIAVDQTILPAEEVETSINLNVDTTNIPKMQSSDVLISLTRGNARFVSGKVQHSSLRDFDRLPSLVREQKPIAAILGCSDSRVDPCIIFDQGLGDLFIVRNAGHVPDASAIESLRYAVKHLHVRLIVALGHSDCGAVRATATNQSDLLIAANFIKHSVVAVPVSSPDWIDEIVHEHIVRTVSHLRHDRILNQYLSNELLIVGMYFPFATGIVSIYSSQV